MKTCFSTLGCPNWSWKEILASARDLQYDGIELRALGSDLYMSGMCIFSLGNLPVTKQDLERKNLKIACIASDCLLHRPDSEEVQKAKQYISLAASLDVRFVRVLGDDWDFPGVNVNTALVESRLADLAPLALESGVTLLVETNGVWADTSRLKDMIERIGSPAVQVLWDINHPYFYFEESPQTTFANIGKYVKHIHVKDSIKNDGSVTPMLGHGNFPLMEAVSVRKASGYNGPNPVYKMLGYGSLPLKEMFSILKNSGYDGFLSLEWAKLWNSELEDAGIVFSHFIYMVKKLWREAQ